MTNELSPKLLRYQAWMLLHYAYDLVIKIEEDTYRMKAGVSYQQFLILMTVAAVENPPTVVELAHMLQRQPNSISTIVDRMVKLSLVKREPSKLDRRLVYVKLTPAGKNIVTRAAIEGNELLQRVTADFSEKELRSLSKLLMKLSSVAAREAGMEANPADKGVQIVQQASQIFNDIVTVS